MRFDPDKHRRRSVRLQGYDYSRDGAYFVTVCTQGRAWVFGDGVDGVMRLNEAGWIVQHAWEDLPTRYPSVEPDTFMVMPNHVHGIIAIVGAGLALPDVQGAASSAPTLGDLMQVFKSISAIQVNRLLSRSGQPLWQRNYYEHIIRHEKELAIIRQYIANNPAQWSLDRENPTVAEHPHRGGPTYLPRPHTGQPRGVAPTDDIETIFGGERP